MLVHYQGQFVCLFVGLFHGVPVVRGGCHLTKDGPCATRRQAEATLFVRRKPTPPFAVCRVPGECAVSGLPCVVFRLPRANLRDHPALHCHGSFEALPCGGWHLICEFLERYLSPRFAEHRETNKQTDKPRFATSDFALLHLCDGSSPWCCCESFMDRPSKVMPFSWRLPTGSDRQCRYDPPDIKTCQPCAGLPNSASAGL